MATLAKRRDRPTGRPNTPVTDVHLPTVAAKVESDMALVEL